MTMDATAPPTLDFGTAPPTVDELGRAWKAVRAGRFREDRTVRADNRLGAATTELPGPVVTVVGAHGWSGASTTALLLAESAFGAGAGSVRLVDAADPVQSGLIGAAINEYGHDQSGNWRRGTRIVSPGGHRLGQLRLERLDRPAEDPCAVPAAAVSEGTTLTVVDAGWPLHELLRLARDPVGRSHWLGRLIRSSTLVLTARATVPGVQRAAIAADQLQSVRTGDQTLTLTSPPAVVLALVGAHRLSRLLAEVVATALPTFPDKERVVLLPSRRDFAVQGVTTSDLPRQLIPAGARLLGMTGCSPAESARPGSPPDLDARGDSTPETGQPRFTTTISRKAHRS